MPGRLRQLPDSNGVLRLILIVIKSYRRWLVVGLALVIVACSYIMWYGAARRSQGKLNALTLLIDPGHGGVDGGAQDHDGHLEKDVNLAVALYLREHLRESGLNIVMTRESDTDLAPFQSGRTGRHRRDLMQRIEKARENRCLFLISIHCDAFTDSARRGAFAFYNYQSPESKALASAIQTQLNLVQQRDFKTAPGKYLIIRQSGVTGVLVEIGFLSNPQEADLLQDTAYQERLAMAIAAGILQYCRNFIS